MYVSRLDRPWLETPFPLEGVLIQSKEDIELLRRYSNFVYVDVEQGPSPSYKYWVTDDKESLSLKGAEPPPIQAFNTNKESEYEKLKKTFYEITTSFAEELDSARKIQQNVEKNIKKVLLDLQRGKALDIEHLKEGVEATVTSIIRNPSALSLLVQIQKTDDYMYNHSLGTSVWCAQFGRHLGLERSELSDLALGGLLLDIGKIKLPKELIHKTTAYTPNDCKLMKTHVKHSVKIIADTRSVSRLILRMVAEHHERFNGSGYPKALDNDAISIYGRIAGIVDSYDAMTSKKPHRDSLFTPHEAINELYHARGTVFQTELVEQFIQTVGLYPTGSLVEFETGEVGVVLEVNDLKRLFPTVMLVLDEDKKPRDEFVTVNLSHLEHSHLKVLKGLPANAYGIKMDQLFI